MPPHTISADVFDVIDDCLSDDAPVLLVGAGVSKRPPSSLPGGFELRDAIIDALIASAQKGGLPESLAVEIAAESFRHGALQTLRLEMLLQAAQDVAGNAAVEAALVVDAVAPNLNHLGIAALQPRLRATLTTNFDKLIETAAATSGVDLPVVAVDDDFAVSLKTGGPPPGTLVKLHGCVSARQSIIATIRQVGRGLSNLRKGVAERCLAGASVVAIGYSGADEDVRQVLAEASLRRLVWVTRDESKLPQELLPLLSAQRGQVLEADLDLFFDKFAPKRLPVNSRVSASWRQSLNAWATGLSPDACLQVLGRIYEHASLMRPAMECYRLVEQRLRTHAGHFPPLAEARLRIKIAGIDNTSSLDENEGRLHALEAGAREIGDPFSEAEALRTHAELLRHHGAYADAYQLFQDAEELYQYVTDNSARRRAQAVLSRASIASMRGDYPLAEALNDAALSSLRESGDLVYIIRTTFHYGLVLKWRGSYDQALANHRKQLHDAQLYGHRQLHAYGLWGLADVLRLKGEFSTARERLSQALEVFRDVGDRSGQSWCLEAMAEIARYLGDIDCVALLAEAYDLEGPSARMYVSLNRGELARLSGDIDGARHHYLECQVLAQAEHCRREELYAELCLAQIDTFPRRDDNNLDRISEAFRRMGMPWGEIHADMVRLLRQTGEAASQRDELTALRVRCASHRFPLEVREIDQLLGNGTDGVTRRMLFP